MAIYWDEKVFLFGLEASYGTAPTLTGTDAILATNIRVQPMEGTDVSRNLERALQGAQETIPTAIHAKVTFTTEVIPSGTAGTAPVIGKLLRVCDFAQTIVPTTSVTYTRVRSAESGALHLWIGNTRFSMIGAQGTGTLRVNAQGLLVVEFELTGLFVPPGEAPPVVPSMDAQLDAELLVATSANTPTFTIDGVPMVMRSFALNFGNRVVGRFLVGSERIRITGKSEMVETTVEAVPLTTLNPFALAQARTKVPIVLTHGTAPGSIFGVSTARAQMQRPTGLEEQDGILEWPLRLVPLPTSAGNNQLSLIFT